MSMSESDTSHPLSEYACEPFTAELSGKTIVTRDVYRAPRDGPTVIVLHEATGLTANTIALADQIRRRRMTPVMPVLVGRALPGRMAGLRNFGVVCVRREFGMWAANEPGPIVDWLEALARTEQELSPNRRVGVIGMCFSGGFSLAMTREASVVAAVSSQQAFPAAIPGRRQSLGLSSQDLDRIRSRTADGSCIRALRYQRDFLSPGHRRGQLMLELPRVDNVEIQTWNPFDHSVLSDGLSAPNNSDLASALEGTLQFLEQRLTGPHPDAPPST